MCDWIFSADSLVDFLCFCFAVNTMFSFAKIRNRLLWRLKKGLTEIVEDNQAAIADCEASMEKFSDEIKKIAKKCTQVKDYFAEIEQLNQKYKRRFDLISQQSMYVFRFAAGVSAFLMVFSQCPWLQLCYQWTLLLLLPGVVFCIISLYYCSKIESILKEKKREMSNDASKINDYKNFISAINRQISSQK